MAEDTSKEASETGVEPSQTPEHPEASPEAAVDTTDPQVPAKEPPADGTPLATGDGPTADASAAAEPVREGIDPQLIALCLGLWVVALGILFVKWDGLRVDWYLGNIKEAIVVEGRLDESSMDAIVGMSEGGTDVVPFLRDELYGPQANADEIYRIAMVKILERVETGSGAVEALSFAVRDLDPRVRANTYVSLKVRAEAFPAEREAAVEAIRTGLSQESEIIAASYAVRMLDELEALEDVQTQDAWGFIRGIREAVGDEARQIRVESLAALRALTGASEEELPYDVDAPLETRLEQARAWETWFVEHGGQVPEGQAFADFEEALREVQRRGQLGDDAGAAAPEPDEGGPASDEQDDAAAADEAEGAE